MVPAMEDRMSNSMKLLPSLAALALIALSIAPANAEERVCRGAIGAVTVDNLLVPQGARCTLNRTRVQGTVKVSRGATLVANDVLVIGNVQGEGAASVRVLDGSRIGGSVQVVQGMAATVADSRINGDILYDAQRRAVSVMRSVIGGDVQAFQNRGGVRIHRNRIDGNLQCKANNPVPVGGGNVVGGNKEDQCRRL
jgi:hypothetical protein